MFGVHGSRQDEKSGSSSRACRLPLVLIVSAIGFAVVSACGGSGPGNLDDEAVTADQLLDDLELGVVVPVTVTESKSVRYVTATGTRAGDQEMVVDHLARAFSENGWTILAQRDVDVTQSPATEGNEVIAEKDGLIARAAILDQTGTRVPPAGSRWVQLAVSRPNEALAWTRP